MIIVSCTSKILVCITTTSKAIMHKNRSILCPLVKIFSELILIVIRIPETMLSISEHAREKDIGLHEIVYEPCSVILSFLGVLCQPILNFQQKYFSH